jgi:hypothetical protein
VAWGSFEYRQSLSSQIHPSAGLPAAVRLFASSLGVRPAEAESTRSRTTNATLHAAGRPPHRSLGSTAFPRSTFASFATAYPLLPRTIAT